MRGMMLGVANKFKSGPGTDFSVNSASPNGTTQYFAPDITDISSYTGLTASIWVSPTAADFEGNVYEIKNPSDTSTFSIYVGDGSVSNRATFQWRSGAGGTTVNTIAADTLVVGNWYHLLLTSDSGGTRAYINGVEQFDNISETIYESGQVFNIGKLTGSTFYSSALLSFASQYNRSVSQIEVTEMYKIGKPNCFASLSPGLQSGCTYFARLASWSSNAGGELVDQSSSGVTTVNMNSTTFTGADLVVSCP